MKSTKKANHKSSHSKISLIAIFVVALLLAANLLVSNILATAGDQIRTLSERKENLEEQNAVLKEKIVTESSLLVLGKKAEARGFVKQRQTIEIFSEPPVAMRQP